MLGADERHFRVASTFLQYATATMILRPRLEGTLCRNSPLIAVASLVGDRSLLALAAVILTGCGSSHEPSRAVSELYLTVYSSEREDNRNLMVVGESGSARVVTDTRDGCLIEAPCQITVDVELRSSAPDVVSLLQERVRTPGDVALVAHAPGTATVTVTADGLTKSQRVDVVTAPLPLDAIQVTLTNWNELPHQYDASYSLTWVEVPVGQFGALVFTGRRNGAFVWGIPYQISSSAAGVASVMLGCRPPSVDPQCDTFSDAWIKGVAPGDATITVSGRNVSTSLTAHVVEAHPHLQELSRKTHRRFP